MKIALSVIHALQYQFVSPVKDLLVIYKPTDTDVSERNLLTLYFLYTPLARIDTVHISQFIESNYAFEPTFLKSYHTKIFIDTLFKKRKQEIEHYFDKAIYSRVDNIYPNLSAWLLSIGQEKGISYFQQFHTPQNVYQTPKYHFLTHLLLRPQPQEFKDIKEMLLYLKKTHNFLKSITPAHILWTSLLQNQEIQTPVIRSQIVDNFKVMDKPRDKNQSITSFITQMNVQTQTQQLIQTFLDNLPIFLEKHLAKQTLPKTLNTKEKIKKTHKI